MATGTLTNTTIAATYKSLLKVKGGANTVLHATTHQLIEDGDGNDSVLSLAIDSVGITGSGKKLYFSDKGGEYLSGNGTDLTIGSGADIHLTATSDVNIPVNVGLRFGDGGENIETDNTDLTITSGGDIILSPTSNVGIGTASPSVPLDVVGTLKVGAASGGRYFNLINDSANSYLDVSHGLVVRTNGASSLVSSMFISTAGNVGIGSADPQSLLALQSGALSITSVSTATACGFYMDAQHVALGADSTQDLWTVTFQDNYGSAIVELQFAGQGHADSDPYIIGTYRLINSNTSVAVTDISEAVAACTTDQTTSTSSCTFRITETSTQNVRGTAWIRVVGGGNDANTEASSGLTLTQD